MAANAFPENSARKSARSNGAVSRVMPEKFSGILNRQPMLNYAKRRLLSGQRAFAQPRKHRPQYQTNCREIGTKSILMIEKNDLTDTCS